MYEKIIENNEAFEVMLICTTAMSNATSPAFEADARKVISFVGEAYSMDPATLALCEDVILGDLMALSLTNDRLALYRGRSMSGSYSEIDPLFDMKANVMAKFSHLPEQTRTLNVEWFNYSHYMAYHPVVRYSTLLQTATTGEVWPAMTVGVLTALGIGCERNYLYAIERLKQCAYWGYTPALLLLSHTYELNGDVEKAVDFKTIHDLCRRYMLLGKTELPETESVNTFVKETFSVIASIFYDVVRGYDLPNINYSFVEAITSPALTFSEVMHFINNYQRTSANWRDVTNPSNDSRKRTVGF
ncbi:MAG: hypothetical protein J6U39_03700 [Clostridia bacterium]|nr:hypothetical protein [Clostridia bacterium]